MSTPTEQLPLTFASVAPRLYGHRLAPIVIRSDREFLGTDEKTYVLGTIVKTGRGIRLRGQGSFRRESLEVIG